MKYSFINLLRNAVSEHKDWPRAWDNPSLKSRYDVVVIGGGGHGLATAYYLAKSHNIRNVAVIERGWIGGGNTGRNTTIIRSNYLYPESAALYKFAHDMWPGLSGELNFNIMYSPRGAYRLIHSEFEMDAAKRQYLTMRRYGMDVKILEKDELERQIPLLNLSPDARFPICGAFVQRNAGVARHDSVAWGYARQASALGVDIIQRCQVTGIDIKGKRVSKLSTNQGEISADKVVICVAGDVSELADMAGIGLPVSTIPLQAFVSEPIKPIVNNIVISDTLVTYVSQTDKGELVIGTNSDPYVSYKRRGSIHSVENSIAAFCELFPSFRRLRLMRQWGGNCDVTPDASPIVGFTPIDGLFINCGFGTGGFKATPGAGYLLADTIANNRSHPILEPFSLDRFTRGQLLNEHAAAGGH